MQDNKGSDSTEGHPLGGPESCDDLPVPAEHKQMDLWPEIGLRARLSTLRAKSSSIWRHRHPQLRRRLVAVFSAVSIIAILIWLWTHSTDPDRDFKITNFLAAFYPVPLSVFVAFLPDMERSQKLRPVWRIGIVVAGLAYSLILWHQQAVNIAASRHDQEQIVANAVQKSNQHADQQNAGLRNSVKEVSGNISDVSKHSDDQISAVRNDVRNSNDKLIDLYSKTTSGFSGLDASISKVGKPDPPVPVSFQFTLWGDGTGWPILTTPLRPSKDGIFSVEFTVTNISPTAAHNADLWVDVCIACSFAKEPDGFDRPSGMPDQTRHMQVGLLNPGAAMPKRIIEVKAPLSTEYFVIGGRYSCELCGGKVSPTQLVRIVVLPAQPEK